LQMLAGGGGKRALALRKKILDDPKWKRKSPQGRNTAACRDGEEDRTGKDENEQPRVDYKALIVLLIGREFFRRGGRGHDFRYEGKEKNLIKTVGDRFTLGGGGDSSLKGRESLCQKSTDLLSRGRLVKKKVKKGKQKR